MAVNMKELEAKYHERGAEVERLKKRITELEEDNKALRDWEEMTRVSKDKLSKYYSQFCYEGREGRIHEDNDYGHRELEPGCPLWDYIVNLENKAKSLEAAAVQWRGAEVKADRNKDIVAVCQTPAWVEVVVISAVAGATWLHTVKTYNIVKWCYADELIKSAEVKGE